MAEGVRERMVRSAVVLLSRAGVQGASFGAVLGRSGAPRGSIFHHFPGGKEEMVTAALDYMGSDGLAVFGRLSGTGVDGVIDGFVAMWRNLLQLSDFSNGCSALGVTVTSDSNTLRERAAGVFEAWAERLTELLAEAGLGRPDAEEFAWMLIATTEGAVVLARAQRSMRPLNVAQDQLQRLARILAAQ